AAQIPQSEVPLPKNTKVWVPCEFGPKDEVYNLSYLVKHSIRDSVVHVRLAVDIHDQMINKDATLTEGVNYVPGTDETIDTVVTNVKARYPKLRFSKAGIIGHENNGLSFWHMTAPRETLEDISKKTNCPWYDIVEHDANGPLRDIYMTAGRDPVDPAVRGSVLVDSVARVFIPLGIPEEVRSQRHRIREFNGKLHIVKQGKQNFLTPGKAIWIPSENVLSATSFADCDHAVQVCQPAFEFIHHLNKARNYILPAMNLCRTYLDIYEVLSGYLDVARTEIEGAVTEYMRKGDHKKCNLRGEWASMVVTFDSRKHGALKKAVFGIRTKGYNYACMRSALQNVRKRAGKPEVYSVAGSDETFESIAAAKGVPVHALIAHNYQAGKIDRETVTYDADKDEWKIKTATLSSGTSLEIPPPNKIDRMLYNGLWRNLGIGVGPGSTNFSADYAGNLFAQASITEMDIKELADDLDKSIEDFYAALAKNRDFHQNNWNRAKPEDRRYYCFYGDVLHQHDMPSIATQMKHKGRNVWKRTTRAEATQFAVDSTAKILFGSIDQALGPLKNAGLDRIGKSGSFLAQQGWSALRGAVTHQDMAPIFFCLFLGEVQREGGNIVLREAVDKGGTQGVSLLRDQVIMGKVVMPTLKKVVGASDSSVKQRITQEHVLDFQKERLTLSAHWTDKKHLKDKQRALNEAARETDELMIKISRHFMHAWDRWFGDVFPRLEHLEQYKKDRNLGLTGCRDCYKHLQSLYEFQHELDKSERYLMAATSLVYRLRAWEAYLSTIEKDLLATLDKSAGTWVRAGDHSNCLRSKKIGHRNCYGPKEGEASQPARPLRDRPPQTPEKAEPTLSKNISVSDRDIERQTQTAYRTGRPLPPPPPPKKPLPKPPGA
ncbi:MAG: hypothetical protein KKA42_01895, partial [candidate division Zixibacteria bacterium]|nr:hypothetical protein [candidate division Zixibacteria bacterium]